MELRTPGLQLVFKDYEDRLRSYGLPVDASALDSETRFPIITDNHKTVS